MDFTIKVPEEHQDNFVDLLCLGGNYKEYVDDPDNPGKMKLNDITKPEFAEDRVEIIVFEYVAGQNHRKKEDKLREEQQELAKQETSFDSFLKR